MNIIFFSISFLRLVGVLFSRHQCRFRRNLDSYCVRVGRLKAGKVTARGRELGEYDGNEKGWSVVCV